MNERKGASRIIIMFFKIQFNRNLVGYAKRNDFIGVRWWLGWRITSSHGNQLGGDEELAERRRVMAVADFMVVFLPAPTVSLRPPVSLNAGGASYRNGAKLFGVGTASLLGLCYSYVSFLLNWPSSILEAWNSLINLKLPASVGYGVYMAFEAISETLTKLCKDESDFVILYNRAPKGLWPRGTHVEVMCPVVGSSLAMWLCRILYDIGTLKGLKRKDVQLLRKFGIQFKGASKMQKLAGIRSTILIL
nr:hypothetical protein [Tanacetum cinerariifolium]